MRWRRRLDLDLPVVQAIEGIAGLKKTDCMAGTCVLHSSLVVD